MTTTETLKLALEALKQIDEAMPFPVAKLAQSALREALASQGEALASEAIEQPAQPQQEPVAWMVWGENNVPSLTFTKPSDKYVFDSLYTTPPQRTWVNATTWVGLTDEEIDQGLLRSDYAFKTAEAWRAGVVFAMTKLKEKNCG